MKILVLNCGSSSLKAQVFETSPEQIAETADRVLAKALVERIGTGDAIISVSATGRRSRDTPPVANMDEAIKAVIGAIAPYGPIEAVGHRVVHGGETFHEPVEFTEEVVERIERIPHQPAELARTGLDDPHQRRTAFCPGHIALPARPATAGVSLAPTPIRAGNALP